MVWSTDRTVGGCGSWGGGQSGPTYDNTVGMTCMVSHWVQYSGDVGQLLRLVGQLVMAVHCRAFFAIWVVVAGSVQLHTCCIPLGMLRKWLLCPQVVVGPIVPVRMHRQLAFACPRYLSPGLIIV